MTLLVSLRTLTVSDGRSVLVDPTLIGGRALMSIMLVPSRPEASR